MSLSRFALYAFWFATLIIGVFYVIHRLQRQKVKKILSQHTFIPDTVLKKRILLAQVPDILYFAEEAIPTTDPLLREALRAAYYHWTLSTASFVGLLQRNYQWKSWIEHALQEAELPPDFLYAAASRSQLQPHKKAPQAGLWALDTTTAHTWGLHIDTLLDERLDIFRSTAAVALPLRAEKSTTGNWKSALQAFCNQELACIAEILVLSQLLSAPKRYGYDLPKRHQSPALSYCIAYLPKDPLSPLRWAEAQGIDSTTFCFYNPFLLDPQAPLGERGLYLPLPSHNPISKK